VDSTGTSVVPATLEAWSIAVWAFCLGFVGGAVAGILPRDDNPGKPSFNFTVLLAAALEGGVAAVAILLIRSTARNEMFIAQSVLAGFIGRPIIDTLKTSVLSKLNILRLRRQSELAKNVAAGHLSPEAMRQAFEGVATASTSKETLILALRRLERLEQFTEVVSNKSS
jgi:hypothetical protein